MLHAFLSNRIVTPEGTEAGALLVDGGVITAVCRRSEVPQDAVLDDLSDCALLPGLVDTHVHIN